MQLKRRVRCWIACLDRCRSIRVDIPSFPGAVLGLRERIWRRTSDGSVGWTVGVDVVGSWKGLFTERVMTCEWCGVDMCRVKLWDHSNWRANSSAFSEEREICVPLWSNGGIFCLGAVKYRVIFQNDFCGCKVRRNEYHFAFFSCWSLMRKSWVRRWDRYREVGVRNR